MATQIIRKGENDCRRLLLGLGVGNFNATIMIQYMFLAPSTTDPAMPSIMLMTKHLQIGLRAAGANIGVTGIIDDATAKALIKLVGPEWNHVTWYSLFRAVTEAKNRRSLVEQASGKQIDLGIIPDLPSVPGGILLWTAAASAVWYFCFRKGRR